MKSKEYWNNSFDERYKKLQEDVDNKKRLPLKVSFSVSDIIVHNIFFSSIPDDFDNTQCCSILMITLDESSRVN